jgi:hypothetical protein
MTEGRNKAKIDSWYTQKEKEVIGELLEDIVPYSPLASLHPLPWDCRKHFCYDARISYRADKDNPTRTSLHLGQRKLFIAELRFLCHFLASSQDSALVVYAGASPGHHIPYLASLFPKVVFHLYDPSPFGIAANKQCYLHRQFFSDEIAEEWGRKGCDLFISDIRVADRKASSRPEHSKKASLKYSRRKESSVPSEAQVDKDMKVLSRPEHSKKVFRKESSVPSEAQVDKDMKDQARWARKINPRLGSSLKFRPPYGRGKMVYLSGIIAPQAWAPLSSTEMRLLIKGGDFVEQTYDTGHYEDACYYLNNMLRQFIIYSPHVSMKTPGFDGCFDCTTEFETWLLYLSRRRGEGERSEGERSEGEQGGNKKFKIDLDEIDEYMMELSRQINQPILQAFHGRYIDLPILERRARLFGYD